MYKNLRRFSWIVPLVAIAIGIAACSESTLVDDDSDFAGSALSKKGDITGNGAPSGPHFSLNVIATKDKNANLTGGSGHRIFVRLGKRGDAATTRILLCNSSDENGDCPDADFAVLDANGTDGVAEFALPDPCAADDSDPTQECLSTSYSVWARALGKPGLTAQLTTCADTTANGIPTDDYCSTETIEFEHKGRQAPKFGDVSRYLLTLALDFTVTDATLNVAECLVNGAEVGEQITKRVGLFNSCLQEYFWKYDNEGLRLLQLRFYAIPSDLPVSPGEV